ncbi:MAG: hypothetical protein N2Z70_03525 [Bdellovibrionaceae bacterium]|jgi:hypothetical protein|nr:hypothetical protein [Pseudobdellovibrionaceae bacterium]
MGYKLTHTPLGHAKPETRPSQIFRKASARKEARHISTKFPGLDGRLGRASCFAIKLGSLIAWISLTSFTAMASGLRVIEVRPGFPLHSQHTPVTDYYLSGGKNQGLKVGQLIFLYRYTSVTDPKNQQEKIQMKVPVAQVEVVYVEDKISVARLKVANQETKSPRLELPSVALGDWAEGF